MLKLIHHRLVIQTHHNILLVWGRHHRRNKTHELGFQIAIFLAGIS
jgi:hypothetical protein